MKKKGFTLIELLVVIAIIALLVSILMPSLGRVREMARRALCQSNLSAIGKGIAMYKAEYNDSYPWLRGQPIGQGGIDPYEWWDCNGDPNTYADDNAPVGGLDMDDPNDWGGRSEDPPDCFGEDIVNNLNLLAYRGNVAYAAFLCPSTGTKAAIRTNNDEDSTTDPVNNDFGFWMRTAPGSPSDADKSARWFLDYGYHIGYLKIEWNGVGIPSDSGTMINPAGLTDNLDGGFIIMADAPKASSSPDRADGPDNTWNHRNEVVNALSASISVQKVTFNPEANNDVGAFVVDGDDIYSAKEDDDDPNGIIDPDDPNECTPKDEYDQSIYHPRYYVPSS